jgi:glutathione S-transferase
MITVYGFNRVRELVIGETRDLRALWALEETGLPYRLHGLDYIKGETQTEVYRRISPFNQVPVIDDEGFLVAETGAIVIYIAEKACMLIPADLEGRSHVTQWCCTALSTIEPTLLQIQVIDGGGEKTTGAQRRPALIERASEKFKVLEDQLSGRPYLAGHQFTVADIMMTTVLREIRKTKLFEHFPALSDYFARCQARPAWRRTLRAYETRMGAPAGAAD